MKTPLRIAAELAKSHERNAKFADEKMKGMRLDQYGYEQELAAKTWHLETAQKIRGEIQKGSHKAEIEIYYLTTFFMWLEDDIRLICGRIAREEDLQRRAVLCGERGEMERTLFEVGALIGKKGGK